MKQGVTIISCIYYNQCRNYTFTKPVLSCFIAKLHFPCYWCDSYICFRLIHLLSLFFFQFFCKTTEDKIWKFYKIKQIFLCKMKALNNFFVNISKGNHLTNRLLKTSRFWIFPVLKFPVFISLLNTHNPRISRILSGYDVTSRVL